MCIAIVLRVYESFEEELREYCDDPYSCVMSNLAGEMSERLHAVAEDVSTLENSGWLVRVKDNRIFAKNWSVHTMPAGRQQLQKMGLDHEMWELFEHEDYKDEKGPLFCLVCAKAQPHRNLASIPRPVPAPVIVPTEHDLAVLHEYRTHTVSAIMQREDGRFGLDGQTRSRRIK